MRAESATGTTRYSEGGKEGCNAGTGVDGWLRKVLLRVSESLQPHIYCMVACMA